ncbi:hypothetical protein JNO63_07645 [Anaerococcus sp. mt242]|uniref:hypothetical protein n=1 Tax=Anaerococcus sp. mt242 TaxID=2661917 RepID=UPI0019326C62|nr:hypothetical protein [Anaerococcus sp. mt242]MBM0046966.1 hypothetical protein [Anaerococcus sp. mt242]
MDLNLAKQLSYDFSDKIEILLNGKNHFVFNDFDDNFLYLNRAKLAINCVGDSLLVRSSNRELLDELKNKYSNYPAAWFMEVPNLIELQKIVKNYNMSLQNMSPVFVPSRGFKKIESQFSFSRIKEEDFNKYEGVSDFALSYENGVCDQKLILAYFDHQKLICIAGASENSKYLWEVGIEKFDNKPIYNNLASDLLNCMADIIRNEYPDISLIYTTQFSHTRSINLAIRAGFEMGLSVIVAN